jgi:hypothetical protein
MNNYRNLLLLSIISSNILLGEEFNSFPSFQGFNGVVNTPNSKPLNEGEFEFLYTNQVDNFSPLSSVDFRDNKKQESFFLNMGFLPNLDISLRYSHGTDKLTQNDYLSDRIVNFKYQLPFIPNDIATVAFGMQDIGGRAQHLSSKYIVASKEFSSLCTSLGFAKGEDSGSLDGVFGSVEYQPLSWLQVAGEYDTKEWNGVVKSKYSTTINNKNINFGLMAKSSLDYKNIYFGLYSKVLFDDKSLSLPSEKEKRVIPTSIKEFGFSNISIKIKDDTLFFEYENTLYTYSDIDALGMVLGVLAMSNQASTIVVDIKKANITQYRLQVANSEYKKFLKTGKYKKGLIKFLEDSKNRSLYISKSDRFKPILTLQPDFVLVDGSEYGHMDYTLAMQAELSMRLAKGTMVSTRYNIPLSITNNFDNHGIFDYRNRNKTTSEIDQLLLSQFFQLDLPYRWMGLIQLGKFDKELNGIAFETLISDTGGHHALMLKLSSLDDDIYNQMDLYLDKKREEKLLSYRYYIDSLNSNIKITAGEFLYGDSGISFGFKRYFSDLSLEMNLAKTKHNLKGEHYVGKFTLSIPFGSLRRYKSDYIDIKGDYLTYNRRKTLVSKNNSDNISQPHHLKEVNNNFTLEQYYLNRDRFHPAYIQNNYNRLRNIYLEYR